MHTWKRSSPKRNRRRPQRMERLGKTLADRGEDYRLVEDVQVPPNTSRGLALGGALRFDLAC